MSSSSSAASAAGAASPASSAPSPAAASAPSPAAPAAAAPVLAASAAAALQPDHPAGHQRGQAHGHVPGLQGQDPVPLEAKVVALVLHSMGVDDYDPVVVFQLLELAQRYVADVLRDATVFQNHAGRDILSVDDVRLAVQLRLATSFTQPPPRENMLQLACTLNAVPLPAFLSDAPGLQLPPPELRLDAEDRPLSLADASAAAERSRAAAAHLQRQQQHDEEALQNLKDQRQQILEQQQRQQLEQQQLQPVAVPPQQPRGAGEPRPTDTPRTAADVAAAAAATATAATGAAAAAAAVPPPGSLQGGLTS